MAIIEELNINLSVIDSVGVSSCRSLSLQEDARLSAAKLLIFR